MNIKDIINPWSALKEARDYAEQMQDHAIKATDTWKKAMEEIKKRDLTVETQAEELVELKDRVFELEAEKAKAQLSKWQPSVTTLGERHVKYLKNLNDDSVFHEILDALQNELVIKSLKIRDLTALASRDGFLQCLDYFRKMMAEARPKKEPRDTVTGKQK